ncbi:MAG: hypothetical protein KGM15_04340 [Pseudomonadota bacterium]|nr:hypothetical protein [Pseudomonadota bacterium]
MKPMRLAILTAVLAAPLLAPHAALAGAGLGSQFPRACAPGYHPDRGGNCQPNGGESNRFCPDGTVYEPIPDGWMCEPPPREAY